MGSYFRDKMIHIAYLDCQVRDDVSGQVVIYLCETDTEDTFMRCPYRGEYSTLEDHEKIAQAKVRSIYILDHSQSFYTRQLRLYCRISSTKRMPGTFQIGFSEVNGVKSSWDPDTRTARIQRTEAAFIHDLAAGFVCYDETMFFGFVILVYFPHKSSFTTRLSGIAISFKPANWPFKDWLKQVQENLSSAHIKETESSATTEVESSYWENSSSGSSKEVKVQVHLRTEVVLNQTIYSLQMEFVEREFMEREFVKRKSVEEEFEERKLVKRSSIEREHILLASAEGRLVSHRKWLPPKEKEVENLLRFSD
jgi:hypothetical protein